MKLSTKICLSMAVLTVLMTILAGFLLMELDRVNDFVTTLAHRNIPTISVAGQYNNDMSEHRIAEVRHIYATDPAVIARLDKEITQGREKLSAYLNTLQGLIHTPEGREKLDNVKKESRDYFASSDKMLTMSREQKNEQAVNFLINESNKEYLELCDTINALVAYATDNADRVNRRGDEVYTQARNIGIGLTIAAILAAIVLIVLIVRNVIRQLGKDPGELNDIAMRVEHGDYNIDDGSPRIGVYGSIVAMVKALEGHIETARRESENAGEQSRKAEEAMRRAEAAGEQAQAKTEAMLIAADKLEEVAGVVSSASTELSAQIEQSDRGAAESAQRLSEAATAMNEMNATVQEVARNASAASGASAETKAKAEDGARIVEKSLQSINKVHQVSVELKGDMVQLNEHAQAISRIMNVISDIADQTNLLALNAAIEAARAGDAGRGFAVVADEVRKLAEKTMSSTQDVGNAISAIQASTAKSTTSVDDAVARIEEATEYANASGQALEAIVSTVEGTADQVNAIATASEEQSAASEEINHSIVQVNDMSRQTADAMAEAAKAVSDLAAQAQGLTLLIQEMKQS